MNSAPHIDYAVYIAWGIGLLLPAIVGQVTKAHWPSAVKGTVLLALSAATSALALWVDALNSHSPFTWQQFVIGFFGAFVTAQASHSAILKSTPLTNTVTTIAPMGPLPPYPPAGAPPTSGQGPNPGEDPAPPASVGSAGAVPQPPTTPAGGGSAAPAAAG